MTKCEHLAEGVTLYQGDCRELLPTLGAVDHIICDPPYEATLHDAKNSLRGRIRTDKGPDIKGLDFAPIDEIRSEIISHATNVCGGWFIAFCTVEGTAYWAEVINPSPMKYKRACAWVKPDSTPQLNGQGPGQGYECFVCAWNGNGHAKWNAGGKRGVYTHCVNTNRHGEHPTEKPVPLMKEIIRDFTNHGEVVCDPFMGSGTTGIAAVSLGRKFTGIELETKYFDIACKRIADELARPRLFTEAPQPKPVQEALI